MALAPAHSCRLFRAFSLFPPLEKIQTDAQPRRIYRIAFVRHDLVYFPNTRLPSDEYEEIVAFLKKHGIPKVDLIRIGYGTLLENYKEIKQK